MALWHETRNKGRFDIGDVLRSTDGALNGVVILMLAGFVAASWYLIS